MDVECRQKYQAKNPALYAQVAEAETLIYDANGLTALNETALAILRTVLAKDAKFAPAYVQMARVTSNLGYQVSGQFDGAAMSTREDYLKKALALEPKYDYAIALMGYTKMMQGNLDEAEKYYQQVVAMKSGYPLLKSQMAGLATKRGDFKKAIVLATQCLQENKANKWAATAAMTELIFAYQELPGDQNRELEKWQTARVNLNPTVAWFWGDRARFRLFFQNDYERAIQDSEQALKLMDYGVGRYVLAAAYYAKWADLEVKKAGSAEGNEIWAKANQHYPLDMDMVQKFLGTPLLVSKGVILVRKLKGSG